MHDWRKKDNLGPGRLLVLTCIDRNKNLRFMPVKVFSCHPIVSQRLKSIKEFLLLIAFALRGSLPAGPFFDVEESEPQTAGVPSVVSV